MEAGLRFPREHPIQQKAPPSICLRDRTRYGRPPNTAGGLQVATFGNCLIVEPRRQGYTQDFHFNLEQALRNKNLLKTHIIEWHHDGVGHREDGSLILDTDRIKLPQTTDSLSSEVPTEPPPRSKLETYRDCGRCRKPEAKLKCACLATHYCDTRCQREDLPDHRHQKNTLVTQ